LLQPAVVSGRGVAALPEGASELRRTIRAFAWTALSVGFSIVVWIIHAMLFAYR